MSNHLHTVFTFLFLKAASSREDSTTRTKYMKNLSVLTHNGPAQCTFAKNKRGVLRKLKLKFDAQQKNPIHKRLKYFKLNEKFNPPPPQKSVDAL
jgi:hypothetical protein